MKLTNLKEHITALFFIIILFITGCIGERKMNKYVSNKYGETVSVKKIKSDYITINSPLITDDPTPSNSFKKTKKVVPFILYMRFYYQTSCSLNPKIPINQFSSALTTYANSKGLKKKLNGGKLELSIDKVPVSFSFNNDSYFLLFVTWERVYLLPQNQEMTLSYKIINSNDEEIKKGSITVPDPNKIKFPRYLQSVRSATNEYLLQYEENIKSMAKYTVDELMKEL